MRRTILASTILLAVLAALPAAAQLESPLLSKVQLNLVNPGGKSLAMGGAFVSIADDPTAALANPAGLSQLSAWQLGTSGKNLKFEPRLSTANYALDAAGNYALSGPLDVYQPSGSTNELEFASLVVPVYPDLSFAVYRAVNLRYKLDASDLTGGNYRAFFASKTISDSLSLDEQGGLDLRNEMYGVSVGAKFGPVAVGGGVTFNKLKYDLTGGAAGGAHMFLANAGNDPQATADPRINTAVAASVTSGTKTGWVIGTRIILDEAHALAIGGVYRKTPSFDIDYSVNAVFPNGSSPVSFSCGVDDPKVPGSGASACGKFRVPDDWSIGFSGRLTAKLLMAVDIQRIMYSQLNAGFVPLFAYSGGGQRGLANGSSEDGTLYRIGAEYTVPFQNGEVNLRAGWFREPAHGTKLALYDDADRNRIPDLTKPVDVPPFSQAYKVSFDGGEKEDHVSFGLGSTISRIFSIDLAFDIAKTTKSGVVSAFFRF